MVSPTPAAVLSPSEAPVADPIRHVDCAFALLDGPHRPEPGDIVTIALRGSVAFEVDATVQSLEITDEEGEIAILVDDTGCLWALPIQPLPERSRS